MIWFNPAVSIEDFSQRSKGTMVDHVGIRYLEIGPDFLRGSMPVDARTRQPLGLLHGGASVVLAESLASMSGNFIVDQKTHYCVGLEINANHVKSATDGEVIGTARPLHLGRSTQVWEIRIEQNDDLICISRMTLAVRAR